MALLPALVAKRKRALGAAALLALLATPVSAQPLELSVKAAFLPKFARYVEWPPQVRPSAGHPLQLCVIGGDPFGAVLDRAASGETIDGGRVVVRRLQDTRGASSCHIAFVRGTATQPTARMLGSLAGSPVLTVTDSRYGSTRGMIHFALSGGRVSFHIDDGAAARSRLAISSRLLSLALSVRQRRA